MTCNRSKVKYFTYFPIKRVKKHIIVFQVFENPIDAIPHANGQQTVIICKDFSVTFLMLLAYILL